MSQSHLTRSASIRSRSARSSQAELAKKVVPKVEPAKKATTTKVAAPKPIPRTAAAAGPLTRGAQRELKTYEKALTVLHKGEWAQAKELLEKALQEYSDDSGLQDRVRSYLSFCERTLALRSFKPKTVDDHYHLGVLHQNDGEFDEAVKQFDKAAGLEPKNDKVAYALAAVHALRDDRSKALTHLRRAIELNAENRIFAANDSDLTLLRDEVAFSELTGSRD